MLLNGKGKEGTRENKNNVSFSKFHGTVGHTGKVFSSGLVKIKEIEYHQYKNSISHHIKGYGSECRTHEYRIRSEGN